MIDTPGFSSFDAEDLSLELKERLPETFLEFRPEIRELWVWFECDAMAGKIVVVKTTKATKFA